MDYALDEDRYGRAEVCGVALRRLLHGTDMHDGRPCRTYEKRYRDDRNYGFQLFTDTGAVCATDWRDFWGWFPTIERAVLAMLERECPNAALSDTERRVAA